jgi:preprotein translocase subunit SecE
LTLKNFCFILKKRPGEAFLIRRNMNFEKVLKFLKEVKVEVRKVDWPTRQEVIRYSLIVVFVSFVVAVYLGFWDFVFTTILNKFILLK